MKINNFKKSYTVNVHNLRKRINKGIYSGLSIQTHGPWISFLKGRIEVSGILLLRVFPLKLGFRVQFLCTGLYPTLLLTPVFLNEDPVSVMYICKRRGLGGSRAITYARRCPITGSVKFYGDGKDWKTVYSMTSWLTKRNYNTPLMVFSGSS